jgi:hypothetical protein
MSIDPQDKLDITRSGPGSSGRSDDPGLRNPREAGTPKTTSGMKRKFLSVLFRCCNTYGRLYPNAARSHYEGRCPKCGSRTRARIGHEGTDQRIFETG